MREDESPLIILPDDVKMQEFKPCSYYIDGLDTLVFLLEDCSYTEHQVSPSVSLMISEGRTIGVQLHGYARMRESL